MASWRMTHGGRYECPVRYYEHLLHDMLTREVCGHTSTPPILPYNQPYKALSRQVASAFKQTQPVSHRSKPCFSFFAFPIFLSHAAPLTSSSPAAAAAAASVAMHPKDGHYPSPAHCIGTCTADYELYLSAPLTGYSVWSANCSSLSRPCAAHRRAANATLQASIRPCITRYGVWVAIIHGSGDICPRQHQVAARHVQSVHFTQNLSVLPVPSSQ